MDEVKFNEELDKLVTICGKVIEAHHNLLSVDEDDLENAQKYSEELNTAIDNFQRQCFYIMPEVKRKSKVNPEYNILLEKLKDTIKLLF